MAAYGASGGIGGEGIGSNISGTVTAYAGGGGGGSFTGTAGPAGVGGGGTGGRDGGTSPTAGTTNTGGGGGGGATSSGAAGGSGIVIIRYPDIYKDAVSTTATKTTYTGYKVYTFTSSGSIMF
jgi:hypothetical protein